MQSEFYQEYIRSEAWREKAQERMRVDHYRCVMCGRSVDRCKSLQVHHVTYRNLGHEDVMKDLCTVCGSCHQKLHNYYDRERGETYSKDL